MAVNYFDQQKLSSSDAYFLATDEIGTLISRGFLSFGKNAEGETIFVPSSDRALQIMNGLYSLNLSPDGKTVSRELYSVVGGPVNYSIDNASGAPVLKAFYNNDVRNLQAAVPLYNIADVSGGGQSQLDYLTTYTGEASGDTARKEYVTSSFLGGLGDTLGDVVGGVGDIVQDVTTPVVDVAKDVVEKTGDIVQDVTKPIVQPIVEDVIKPVVKTTEEIVSGAADVIGEGVEKVADAAEDVAGKLGDTVEAIVSDPKKLALVAVAIYYPQLALQIGESVGLSGAAATAVGNAAINTAVLGGDVEQAVKMAALQYVGSEVADQTAKSVAGYDKSLAKLAGASAGAGATAAIVGKDPLLAMTTAGVNAAVPALTMEIEGFEQLDPRAQRVINDALKAELTGKDPSQAIVNSALNLGVQAARNAAKWGYVSGPDESGFTSQWQTVGSDRIMIQDDGSAIAINTETGEAYSLYPEEVDQMIENMLLNTEESGYTRAFDISPESLEGAPTKQEGEDAPLTNINFTGMAGLNAAKLAGSSRAAAIRSAGFQKPEGQLGETATGSEQYNWKPPALFQKGLTTGVAIPAEYESIYNPTEEPQLPKSPLEQAGEPMNTYGLDPSLIQVMLQRQEQQSNPTASYYNYGQETPTVPNVSTFSATPFQSTLDTSKMPVGALSSLHTQQFPAAPFYDPRSYVQTYAQGGAAMPSPLMVASGGNVPHKGSHYVQGAGGGQDDLIDARLADGEYVFDADIVAALGDGSNKEGAKKLDQMREAIRKHKRSAPHDKIPPKAKSPLAYLKGIK